MVKTGSIQAWYVQASRGYFSKLGTHGGPADTGDQRIYSLGLQGWARVQCQGLGFDKEVPLSGGLGYQQ